MLAIASVLTIALFIGIDAHLDTVRIAAHNANAGYAE